MTRDLAHALINETLALLPLWLAGIMIVSGRRYKLGFLALFVSWTVASLAWGQVVPRLVGWEDLFTIAVFVSTLTSIVIIARPSIELLRKRLPVVAVITAGFVGIALGISTVSTKAVLQVLGWGHDNSAHVFLVERNASCGGFLFACRVGLDQVPQYLLDYPQGFSVTWASLPEAFSGTGLLNSLHVYALIYLLTSIALIVVTGWLAIAMVRTSRWAWGAGVLASITVLVGVWSHQFWSGFASFLWASLLIVSFLAMREAKLLAPGRLWFVLSAASLVAVYYSHQLLLPFLLVYVAADAIASRYYLIEVARRSAWLIAAVALISVTLVLLAPRSAQGNSVLDQVVVEAGMEAIPLWVWIPLAVVGGFVLFARGDHNRVALRWAMLTSGALFGVLAVLTLRVNGYVSYYPMKLLTFLVLILIAATAAVAVAKPIETRAHQTWFTLSAIAALGLAVLPPFLRYPGFKTAYQGATPTVIRTVAQDPFGGGVALCAPFVLDAVDRLPSDIGRVEVHRNGELQPLEARWINQIRGHWDTTAWLNEVDWRPMEEIPADQLPDMIVSHDSLGLTPEDVPRLELGEPCDRQQLPPVLPIG